MNWNLAIWNRNNENLQPPQQLDIISISSNQSDSVYSNHQFSPDSNLLLRPCLSIQTSESGLPELSPKSLSNLSALVINLSQDNLSVSSSSDNSITPLLKRQSPMKTLNNSETAPTSPSREPQPVPVEHILNSSETHTLETKSPSKQTSGSNCPAVSVQTTIDEDVNLLDEIIEVICEVSNSVCDVSITICQTICETIDEVIADIKQLFKFRGTQPVPLVRKVIVPYNVSHNTTLTPMML